MTKLEVLVTSHRQEASVVVYMYSHLGILGEFSIRSNLFNCRCLGVAWPGPVQEAAWFRKRRCGLVAGSWFLNSGPGFESSALPGSEFEFSGHEFNFLHVLNQRSNCFRTN